MSENLFDILDDCLRRLDSGEDVESCLGHYPRHASELRPLLLAAMDAESIAPADTVPPETMKRGKARLLNTAAEMREQKVARKTFATFNFQPVFRRVVSVLAVLLLFILLGGTGLVRASTASLPGDQLYPVKRTWEQVLLQIVTDPKARANLEIEFENERIAELSHIIDLGREAKIEFTGKVTGIFPDQLIVSGFTVKITGATKMDAGIALDSWVEVEGATLPDGSISAAEIKLEDGDEDNRESQGSGSGSQKDDSNSGSSTDDHEAEDDKTPENPDDDKSGSGEDDNEKVATAQSATSNSGTGSGSQAATPQLKQFDIEGNIQAMGGGSITVSGKVIKYNSATELRGTLQVGGQVKVRGIIQSDGSLYATRIEAASSGGGEDSGSGGDDSPTPDATDDEEDDDDHSGSGGG